MKWRSPKTAPRDMNPFIADIGLPTPVLAVWNPPAAHFCTTELQVDLLHGEYQDTYFQNEHIHPDDLIGWMPLPKTGRKKS